MTERVQNNFNIDMLVSLLRSQIVTLEGILKNIEQGNSIDEYADAGIKRVEKNLRWLRKLFTNS